LACTPIAAFAQAVDADVTKRSAGRFRALVAWPRRREEPTDALSTTRFAVREHHGARPTSSPCARHVGAL